VKISSARKEITPKESCYLCGHAMRTDKSEGILDPLYCTAVTLESTNVKFCFASVDLAMMDKEGSEYIKEEVSKKTLINKEHIFIGATHTHSGPEFQINSSFSNESGKGATPEYRNFLIETIISTMVESGDNLKSASAYFAKTMINGFYGNRNDINAPSDKSVNLVQFRDESENTILTMVNLTCHSTVLGPHNLLISGDLHAAVRNKLEKEFKSSIFMMQGAAGDMSNRQYRKGEDPEELEYISDGIVKQLLVPLSWEKIDDSIFVYQKFNYINNYTIPLEKIKEKLDKFIKELNNETNPVQQKLLISATTVLKSLVTSKKSEYSLELESSIIRIGKCIIVAVPAELFSKFAADIRKEFPDYNIIIWGYVNYSAGYLVEEKEYGKSFESIASQIPKGEPEEYVSKIISEIKKVI